MTNYLAVERALRSAAPHALLEAVRNTLVQFYGALAVDLLMADYSLRVLQPVTALPHTGQGLAVHASVPGRAFGSQQPQLEAVPGRDGGPDRVVAHLPVTVRGDRLGVLSVELPADSAAAPLVAELGQVASLLGHEIVVAERDTDVYLQARRVARLTLAAEMQWQLLPGRSCARAEYAIGAQLDPAYAIYGDNFDWATTAETLTLTITNGMGEGISASLLTNLAVNALRNARRAGIGIADQAALADQALYAQHRGKVHVASLLMCFELATGQVTAVDAGSPQLWRLRDKAAERIEFDAQLPLGMFEETAYAAQSFRVLPGDRLVCVSDGVYDTSSPAGERYGERALARAIVASALVPAADVPGAILRELADYRAADAADDALVVCLDWTGRNESGTAR
ncbi:PP2C family protein-serine/threonine phosphatase [Streptacidiphilus sp. N1-12]|uniref:PP2C family protein-serine/threonine phosphatase n=2 Tax=Streptacidiphilus alkalitolerans TaxID=3342712 RepID=A0ABV6WPY5_9ACTN